MIVILSLPVTCHNLVVARLAESDNLSQIMSLCTICLNHHIIYIVLIIPVADCEIRPADWIPGAGVQWPNEVAGGTIYIYLFIDIYKP